MDRFEARMSPVRTSLILLGSIGFVALGIVFVFQSAEIAGTRRDPALVQFVGVLAILLFGFFSVAIARQLFRTEPVMEIDTRGILWRRWSDEIVPWDAIDHAEVTMIQRQRFVSLWLRDAGQYRSSKLLGKLQGTNRSMGFGDIALSVPGTDRSFDDLVAAVDRFAPGLRHQA